LKGLQFSLATLFSVFTQIIAVLMMVHMGTAIQGKLVFKICAPIIVASFGTLIGFAIRGKVNWLGGALGAILVLSFFSIVLAPAN
jgi:hypothetical protein